MPEITNSQYKSLQPAFEKNFKCYREQTKVSLAFQSYVDYYYELKTLTANDLSIPILPDGCMDIVFSKGIEKTEAYVIGTAAEFVGLLAQKGHNIFGIRFKPGGFRLFMGNNSDLFITSQQNANLFFKNISELCETLFSCSSFEQRIEIAEAFLFENLKARDTYRLVVYCIEKIRLSKGIISINALADDTLYSRRYLHKIFKDYIGLSPQTVKDIFKIQSTVRYMQQESLGLADIAVLSGFCDQSHMNKVLKKFFKATSCEIKNPDFFEGNRDRLHNVYFI